MFSIVSISFALSFAGVHTHTLNVNFYSDHCGLAAILYLHNSVQIVCCVQIINCQSTWVKRTIVCLFSRYNIDLKATVELWVTFHICKKNQQLCFSWTRTSWESGLHCGSCGGCRMAPTGSRFTQTPGNKSVVQRSDTRVQMCQTIVCHRVNF